MNRTINVNSIVYPVSVPRDHSLLEVLRNHLGLTGTKRGCACGACGACTVLVNNEPFRSCQISLDDVQGKKITTIEGLSSKGKLHPLQEAFLETGAVQCGYCTPGMILSAFSLIMKNPDPTSDDIKNALQGNLCRCTGYQPVIDAVLLAAKRMKNGGDFTVANNKSEHSPPRIDGFDKVRGTAIYTDDCHIQDLCYGTVLWSPVSAGKLLHIDCDLAIKTPGVIDILTWKDVPGINRIGRWRKDKPVFVEDMIRFSGDVLALVVANNRDIGKEALKKIKYQIEPRQGVFKIENQMCDSSKELFPLGTTVSEISILKGQNSKTDSSESVTTSFKTNFVEHALLEPESAVAFFDDNTLIIKAPSQNVFFDRSEILKILGLSLRDASRIRVIQMVTGGAFGKREDMVAQPLAALAAWKTRRPVKVVFTREESFRSTTKRHPMSYTHCSFLDKKGSIFHQEVDILADTGAYASWAPNILRKAAVHASGPYSIPSVKIRGKSIHSNSAFSGAMRGFGGTQSIFAAELHMERLAAQMDRDPVQYRIDQALKEGSKTITGQTLTGNPGLPSVLKAASDAFKWKGPLKGKVIERGIFEGVGAAGAYYGIGYGNGIPDKGQVELSINETGKVELYTGAIDYGQGSSTVFAQIISAILGIPFSEISVITGDTLTTPDSGSTVASRQTFVTGSAVVQAAGKLKTELLKGVKHLLDVDTLKVRDNHWIDATGSRVSFKNICTNAFENNLKLRYRGRHMNRTEKLDSETGQGDIYRSYAFAAACARVRVNVITGRISILHVVSAHNSGRIINPVLARSQVTGGVIMAAGMALSEKYIVHEGIPETLDFNSYKIPRMKDIPVIDTVFVEKDDPEGPLGARGLGEPAMLAAGPAIVNAVSDAIGIYPDQIPLTPEIIKKLIHADSGKTVGMHE